MNRILMLIPIAALLLASACHEIPQDAKKPFAGEKARELYAGTRFDGDKAAFEAALANRAKYQNEYVRIPN
jgi:hypothetical protein